MSKDIDVAFTRVGGLETNCYIAYDEKRNGVLIDPGAVSANVDFLLGSFKIQYILLTHGHFDHISAVKHYQKETSAKIVMPEEELDFIEDKELNLSNSGIELFDVDIKVKDGDEIEFGDKKIKVMSTQGHTKGSVCYIIDNSIFSGDTIMAGSIGRVDLPTGSYQGMKKSLKKIADMLEQRDYFIYPGHGDSTTLSKEKKENPYLSRV